MTKSAQDLAKERGDRLVAAMNLETPDKIPVVGIGGNIVASYGGIT